MQANDIPLLSGIVVALIWCNADPASYEYIVGAGHGALRIFGKVGACNPCSMPVVSPCQLLRSDRGLLSL